jgi:uncharacterized protein (DUF2062 family)
MLGQEHMIALSEVFEAFRGASSQLWANFTAMFTPATAHWDKLAIFYDTVFWPYMVGGLVPGVITGATAYMLARPAVSAYQKARIKRLKARYQKRRAAGLSKG